MKSKQTFLNKKLTDKQNHNFLSLIFSVILLVILVRMPEPGTFSGQNWRVELLLSVFLFVIFGLALYKNKPDFNPLIIQSKYFKPIIYLLSFFIIWGGISIFWAKSEWAVIYHTLTWSVYLTVFISLVSYLHKTKNLKPLFTVFIFVSLILIINIIVDLLTVEALINFGNFKIDVKSPRITYAKFAELLVTFSPLLWIIPIYFKKGKKFYFFLFVGAASWFGVMLSLSRGAFLGGVCSFLFCFVAVLLFSKKIFRKRILLLAFLWISLTVSHQVIFSNFSNIRSTASFATAKAEKETKTTSFRIFVWKVSGIMISENLLKGVGADNYGIAFNDYRAKYAKLFPQDEGNTTAEDYIVERSHNEYLQVFAELGIIGGSIFLLILILFTVWICSSFIKTRFKASPVFLGSLAGVMAFLISSLTSSFSFRLMQNGVIFLMVLSILVYELMKIDKKINKKNSLKSIYKFPLNKPVFASALLILLLTGIFSSLNAVSNYYVYLAENESDTQTALTFYNKSLMLNSENPSSYFSRGMRLYSEKRMVESSQNLQKAIDLGLGTVISYSYLAETYEKSGDFDSAEKTMAESVSIFPNSILTRVRYSIILEKTRKINLAEKQMEVAKNFDTKAAKGWSNLIKYGSLKAFKIYKQSNDVTHPASLRPKDANLQFLDKIKLPQTAKK